MHFLFLSEHLDIYLQLCIWNYYLIFSIASQVISRLLLNELYYLKLPFDRSLMECWLQFTWESILDFITVSCLNQVVVWARFTLPLLVNRLNKSASHLQTFSPRLFVPIISFFLSFFILLAQRTGNPCTLHASNYLFANIKGDIICHRLSF